MARIALVINDQKLFRPGHLIHRWATDMKSDVEHIAVTRAPINKRTRKFPGNPPRGTLKRLIKGKVDTEGPRALGIIILSGANYSVYVHEGTKDTYHRDSLGRFGEAKGGFPLPTNNYGKFKRVQRIRGQRAQPFLREALFFASRTHPSLRTGAQLRRL